ncbi:MAG: rhodanese-like domain-containing protein [Eubacteriales bacterium]|nr:rhodanese-like domain-containing protein [Eubacteriales bacterium]
MKTMIKRGLLVFIALMLVFSLAACGQSTVAAPPATNTSVDQSVDAEETSLEDLVAAYFTNMPDDIYKIDQGAFLEKVAEGQDMFILDIRQADAYEKGHVRGAVNIPWGPAIADSLEFIPQDQTVYVYCYSGQTAGQAVMTLNAAGIDAKSVNLGFNFGISKVDGHQAFLETEEYVLGAETYPVSPEVQSAIDDYYYGLSDSPYTNYIIPEVALRTLIDADEDIYVLSVRSKAHFDEGHIIGADHIAFGKDMHLEFDKIPQDEPVYVYCYSGQTAGQVVAGLKLLGYEAYSLNGGMGVGANAPLGWANKGYPVHFVEEAALDYFKNFESNNIVPAADVLAAIDAEEDIFILDIRQTDVYEQGHLKGAVSAPWNGELGQIVDNLPMDKSVYVYCYTGQTAGQAVALFRMAGIDAKSIGLGFVRGISKVEGIDNYLETEENVLETDKVNEINPAVRSAVVKYFEAMAASEITNFIIPSTGLFDKLQTGDESIFVISARQPDVYAEGHIDTAVNMPFGLDMNAYFKEIPRDKTAIVYCYTGQTAGQAIAVLRMLGYQAWSLNSGMGTPATAPAGWVNEGFPVVK